MCEYIFALYRTRLNRFMYRLVCTSSQYVAVTSVFHEFVFLFFVNTVYLQACEAFAPHQRDEG